MGVVSSSSRNDTSFARTLYNAISMRSLSRPETTPISELITWIVASIASFVYSYKSGDLLRWRMGTYEPLPSKVLKDNGKMKASEQRTFSYPDTLEYNYFDPDNLPRHLQAHADIIFSTVQSLASELGFQVDSSRNQVELVNDVVKRM